MKLIYPLIVVGCCLFSNLTLAEVTNDDLRNIEKLVENGEYELALKKHVLFHEESKASMGMGGVRLSYALSDWKRLANKYPPALAKFREIRDKNKEKVISGQSIFGSFSDYSAINRTLKEEMQTIEFFKELVDNFPEKASRIYLLVEDLLIDKKELALVNKYMTDPIFKYEGFRYSRENYLRLARRPDANSHDVEYDNKQFVQKTLQLIKTLLAIDRHAEAIEIHKRATEYFENEKLRNALDSAPQ